MTSPVMLLLNTVVALVGLAVAHAQVEHSRFKTMLTIAAALALTVPLYAVAGLERAGATSGVPGTIGFVLLLIALPLQFLAWGVIAWQAVDVLHRQRRDQPGDIEVPTVSPYGRSAFDTDPSPAPGAEDADASSAGKP